MNKRVDFNPPRSLIAYIDPKHESLSTPYYINLIPLKSEIPSISSSSSSSLPSPNCNLQRERVRERNLDIQSMAMGMVDLESNTQTQTQSQEPNAIFSQATRPVILKFEDVVYTIKIEKGGGLFKKKKKTEEKTILKGVTGLVLPGEMLAMLGPSGSGKTTLLTALGGRLSGGLSGSITYNGEPFSNRMKRNTGFVTQDDILYPHLTVTETLVFTALLRLKNNMTKEEKISHAEAVITQLGLTRCKNSIIGGPLVRGVSGGERKRVSIGQEMLINPSLLFLDEPTSGLDSTTAQRIVSTLWELSNGGRTIVMTIHQPSSRLFYMFHKVLLLSEGNPLYFGKGSEAMDYFSGVGYAPAVAMNPSDFLLDLANGVSPNDSREDPNAVKQALLTAFRTNIIQNLREEVKKFKDNSSESLEHKKSARWATTWLQQFSVLLRRGMKERKHDAFSGMKMAEVLVVALICGLVWWQSPVSDLQDQVGLLFYHIGFWSYLPMNTAIFTFPQERMMLAKERSSGMYRLSSYFIARTVGDLPMELVLPTGFLTITYWMGGLRRTAGSYFATLGAILLNVLVSQGLGLALGALVMDQKSATMLASVIMMLFILVGGFFVVNVPAFISWIKYLSVSQFSFKLLLSSQYWAGQVYQCGHNKTCLVEDFPLVKTIGIGGHGISVMALLIMLVGYRLIAYVALMRVGATKN